MRQLPVLITISWLITDVYMEVSTKYLFNISLGISYIISSNPWKSPGTNIKSLQFWTLSKSKTCSEFYINITDTKKRFLEFQLICLYYICFFNEITLKKQILTQNNVLIFSVLELEQKKQLNKLITGYTHKKNPDTLKKYRTFLMTFSCYFITCRLFFLWLLSIRKNNIPSIST